MDRSEIGRVLSGKGWEVPAFGVARYERGDISLELDPDPGDDGGATMGLHIVGRDGACVLWLHHGGRVAEVLAAVCGFQDVITPDSFRDHVRALFGVAKKIELQLGDDEDPVELTPD